MKIIKYSCCGDCHFLECPMNYETGILWVCTHPDFDNETLDAIDIIHPDCPLDDAKEPDADRTSSGQVTGQEEGK